MWPTGGTESATLSASMNTNSGIKARSEAKAKEEQTTKLGLDVHAGQVAVCRQQEGLLPQPAQRMNWERCLGWIQEQVENGAKVYSCYEAEPGPGPVPRERGRVFPLYIRRRGRFGGKDF